MCATCALRGDPPGGVGEEWRPHPDGLRYAEDLVRLLRDLGDFCVGVAAFPEKHPEALDLETDAKFLAQKCAAGADFAVTQFFFKPEEYFGLVDDLAKRGVDKPVVPGVMPVTALKSIPAMARMGAAVPPEWVSRLEAAGDEESVRRVGIELMTELCTELMDRGAPGLHFYTLNKSTATREIYKALGLATAG